MTVVPYESRAWLTLQNPALELANAIAATDFVPTTPARQPGRDHRRHPLRRRSRPRPHAVASRRSRSSTAAPPWPPKPSAP